MAASTSPGPLSPQDINTQVHAHYSSIKPSASGTYENNIAKAFGYTDADLASIPRESNLGVSCGNPLALANLREGETVLDLGCGAGFDVFAAAKKVGDSGRVYGVDMNEWEGSLVLMMQAQEMLAKAESTRAHLNFQNVTFVRSSITSISTISSDSVDCIVSNCVINLVPSSEKHVVFEEMFRLLRPGGRVAISDILARKELSGEIRSSVGLYVGCVAGASLVGEYERWLKDAGFAEVKIVDTGSDLNVYFTAAEGVGEADVGERGGGGGCCKASGREGMNAVASAANEAALRMDIGDLNEWAGSFQIYAVKTV